MALSFNSNGELDTQLPQGPSNDAYKIYLSVNIIDDTDGASFYNISSPIIVLPNDMLFDDLSNPNSKLSVGLNSGNLNIVAKNVISLTTVFNMQSSNDTSSELKNQMADFRDFMVQKISSLSISDISSIKLISGALSASTTSLEQVSSNAAVIIQILTFLKKNFTFL